MAAIGVKRVAVLYQWAPGAAGKPVKPTGYAGEWGESWPPCAAAMRSHAQPLALGAARTAPPPPPQLV
jgi:hypothetical protein